MEKETCDATEDRSRTTVSANVDDGVADANSDGAVRCGSFGEKERAEDEEGRPCADAAEHRTSQGSPAASEQEDVVLGWPRTDTTWNTRRFGWRWIPLVESAAIQVSSSVPR